MKPPQPKPLHRLRKPRANSPLDHDLIIPRDCRKSAGKPALFRFRRSSTPAGLTVGPVKSDRECCPSGAIFSSSSPAFGSAVRGPKRRLEGFWACRNLPRKGEVSPQVTEEVWFHTRRPIEAGPNFTPSIGDADISPERGEIGFNANQPNLCMVDCCALNAFRGLSERIRHFFPTPQTPCHHHRTPAAGWIMRRSGSGGRRASRNVP
jgi:hypothetical protein